MGVKYADSDLLRLAGGGGAGAAQRYLYVGIDAHVFHPPQPQRLCGERGVYRQHRRKQRQV